MKIFPAIDIYKGRAVRLLRGDYNAVTDYGVPLERANEFVAAGAKNAHIVDLEGARNGFAAGSTVIEKIAAETPLFIEVGGGIRNMQTAKKYITAGAGRIILGTAAINDREFLRAALGEWGDKVAVGADIKDGFIAVRGWTEISKVPCDEFFYDMQKAGVRTVICTDVSKDGAMIGIDDGLYSRLKQTFDVNVIASGGVSNLDDVARLAAIPVYGAIIGKAYYSGAIKLQDALRVANDN